MSRLICTIGAAALLSLESGCTWQQAYSVRQAWQRNACGRIVEQAEHDRCLRSADMSYEDYRRQIEAPRKD